MSGFRTFAVAVLIAAGLLVSAGAASAQRVVITDEGTADAWETHPDENGRWDGSYTPAGSVANVDVVRTTVTYTRTALRVTAEYADLRKNGPDWPEFDSWVRLGDGGGVFVRASANFDGEGNRKDSVSLYTDKTARPGGQIHHGRCPQAKATFDFRADTATTVVPLSCLPGDSNWVKFHGNALATQQDGTVWLHTWSDNVTDASFDQSTVDRNCFWKCTGWTKVRIN
jgi:hypothetical protein